VKKTLIVLLALVLALTLGLIVTTPVAADPGTTYYVSNSGSDETGTGAWDNPWATIQHAVDQVASSDTIQVASGTYTGAIVDKDVTISGSTSGTSAINTGVPYKVGSGLTTAFRLDSGADGAEVKNFTVNNNAGTSFYFAVFSRGVDDVTIDSLEINDTVQGITNWGGSNWQITNNELNYTEASGGGGIGIFVGAMPTLYRVCSGNVISGNTITATATAPDYSTPGIALALDLRYGGYDLLDGSEDLSGNEVLNNTIVGNGGENSAGIEIGVIGLEGDPIKIAATMGIIDGTVVDGNVIEDVDMGLYFYVASNLTVTDNEMTGCSYGIYATDGIENATIEDNTFSSNAVQVRDYSEDLDLELILANNTFDCAVVVRGSGIKVPAVFSSIQDAIEAAESGDTIEVAAGTYVEEGQIVIDKDLTIIGEDKETTIIKPAQDTGSSGDARGWFLVQDGKEFNLSNVTLDGEGKNVHQAIRSFGSGTIDNNIIKNIRYSQYVGLGVVVMGSYNMTFSNNTFTNIERIGMMAYGSGVTNAVITGNTYTGKGEGDWLDYGIEIGGGAKATITGNNISTCGPSTTAWESAGILATDLYGPGTEATITGNTLMNNAMGVAIGYDDTDLTVATISGNTLENNRYQVDCEANVVVDLEAVLADNTFDRAVVVRGSAIKVPTIFSSIQDAVDAAAPGDTIEVAAGTYNETVTVNKSLHLVGAGCGETMWRGDTITDRSLLVVRDSSAPADVHVEVTGFSFQTENNQTIRADWSTSYAEALTLDIHDNCFAHVNSRNPGTDFALYVDGANQTPRGSQGAIRVYDNSFDVVTGGVLFEYCRAVDVVDNIFDVTYEGVVFNYYGDSGTLGEQLVQGNVFTHVPVDWAFAMNNWHGSGTYTVLPSQILNNVIAGPDFAYAIAYGAQSPQAQVPDFTIFDNAILSGTIIVWGDYAGGVLLNASGNWWGSAGSPAARINTAGTVDYTPWLDSGDDISTDPGFQGDFSTLWVSAASPQTGAVGRIQEGVDMVSGSTVNVVAGTYDGQVTIDKSLTLRGAGEDQTFVKSTGSSPVVTVSADDVTIQDLEITDDTELSEGIRIVPGASTGLIVDHVDFTELGAGTGSNAYGIRVTNSFANLSVSNCDFVAVEHTTYYRTIGIFAPNDLQLSSFEISDSTFQKIWTGIYLRSAIDGLDVTGNEFGPVQSSDFAACVSGIYIGDGSDYNFDIENVTVSDNTFTEYGRGVYVWNYANNATVRNFEIYGNNFTNSVWSSGIRFIAGNGGDEGVSLDGINVHDNVFTQNSTVGAHVALIDFRTYCELAASDIAVTDNEITLSGGPYTDPWTGIAFTAWEGPFTNTVIDGNVLNGGNCGGAGTLPSTGILLRHKSSEYWPSDVLEMDITQNDITAFDHGVGIYDDVALQYGGLPAGSDVDINYNKIHGNALYGVVNGNSELVDVTYNWWGDATGPYHEILNPRGEGDVVSDNVLFDPWYGDEGMTTLVRHSTYKFVYEIPDVIVACEETVVPVTFETDELGDLGYDGVRFKFYATGPGDVTFNATDSTNTTYTFTNSGYWGPPAGFNLTADYTATTDWTLHFSEPGEYTITFSLIAAPDGEVIAGIEGSETITVRAVDILDYYRRLHGADDEVDTLDLLAAADDWSAYVVRPGFEEPITTAQLLQLADEWYAAGS
jgi:parallel beta-helix repeat protein